MIKTSYFARWHKLRFPGAIRISRGASRYHRGSHELPDYPALFPGKTEAIQDYQARLQKMDPETVALELCELAGNDTPVLICHEADPVGLKRGYPCHRHLISQWFNDNGIECQELTV